LVHTNLDRLAELPDRLEIAKFHAWMKQAEPIILATLERAVKGTPLGRAAQEDMAANDDGRNSYSHT
jgi:hypothetical protein